jgi:hypothetical protein
MFKLPRDGASLASLGCLRRLDTSWSSMGSTTQVEEPLFCFENIMSQAVS